MLTKLEMRFFKSGVRVSPKSLSAVDARLYYLYLMEFMKDCRKRYGEILNKNTLFIIHDSKEIYRKRKRLTEAGIDTVADLLAYLNIDNYKYIIIDNSIVDNINLNLSDVYMLEVYSAWSYLTLEQLQVLGKR